MEAFDVPTFSSQLRQAAPLAVERLDQFKVRSVASDALQVDLQHTKRDVTDPKRHGNDLKRTSNPPQMDLKRTQCHDRLWEHHFFPQTGTVGVLNSYLQRVDGQDDLGT